MPVLIRRQRGSTLSGSRDMIRSTHSGPSSSMKKVMNAITTRPMAVPATLSATPSPEPATPEAVEPRFLLERSLLAS